MKDFYHRTITIEDKAHQLEVSRMRTSMGFESITVSLGGRKELMFSTESDTATAPENGAKALIKLLEEIVDNPCTLPKPE